jgi:uncharacterized protein
MEPLYIPHLLTRQNKTLEIIVDQQIPEFETLTPVRGKITVRHGGTFIDVAARTETIVTLTCDRCLRQYNHKLLLNTSEIIWLDDAANDPYEGPLEVHSELEELVESLPPEGHFQPETWLYEQLCLSLPHRQLCAQDCQGIAPVETPIPQPAEPQASVDSRWGVLETLKNQLQKRD